MSEPLKIALILETSGGGSGRHVLDLAKGLVQDGHSVTVVWAPNRADADFVTALEQEQRIAAVPIAMKRSVGPKDMASLRDLRRCIEDHGPFDVIHGHSSKAGALVRLLPRGIAGARVYTPHAFRTMDPELRPLPRRMYSMIERSLEKRGDRTIVVSNAEFKHAASIGYAPAGMTRVVNGAKTPGESGRSKARDMMKLEASDVAIGFVGRLEQQKDPVRFVQAITHAAQHVPNIKGVVIGDGSLRAEAEQKSCSETIRFLGWQDGPALMSGLEIFCMTSRYEAMPYTLLEALHAGVPIITTDVGGAEETVDHGKSGYVLPLSSSPEYISGALQDLAQQPKKREAFARASSRLAETRTIQVMVDETLAVYRTALTERSVSRRSQV